MLKGSDIILVNLGKYFLIALIFSDTEMKLLFSAEEFHYKKLHGFEKAGHSFQFSRHAAVLIWLDTECKAHTWCILGTACMI